MDAWGPGRPDRGSTLYGLQDFPLTCRFGYIVTPEVTSASVLYHRPP